MPNESSQDAETAPFRISMKPLLSGPNSYAPQTVALLKTRFVRPVERLRATPEELHAAVAALAATPGGRELAGLLENAIEATASEPAAELLAELARLNQEPFVIASARGKISISADGALTVLMPTEDADVGIAALALATRMVLAILGESEADSFADLVARYEQFAERARQRCSNPLTIAIARAALRLAIPVYRTDPMSPVLQLGQGFRRQLFFSTMIEQVSNVAASLARDKLATSRVLQRSGIPVLDAIAASSEEETIAAAEKIGGPVVVKPVDGGKGCGVSIALTTPDQLREAYRLAMENGTLAMVERFAEGDDHRLLIVGGEMIAAAMRSPAQVTGNGHSKVSDLIEDLNADPRRGVGIAKLMTKVTVDWRLRDLLARQSLTLDSVPPDGTTIRLSLAGNISQGGTAIDVTHWVHPDNQEAAERAAIQLGIDVAGIDFITPDITRSWREGAGWILEVNASPGLYPHWIGDPGRDVVTPIIRHMFPDGREAHIPTAGVTGSMGKTTTCQMLAGIGRNAGMTVGLATTQGIWSGNFRVAAGDCANGAAALNLLTDPTIELGIFELARGALKKRGMFVEGVDVACVLNVLDNHVGLDGIATREQMAAVKSILIRHARRGAVLNAEDPLVLAMRRLTTAPVTLVALDPDNPEIVAHREEGGCIVVLQGLAEDAIIRVVDGHRTVLELPVEEIPAARGGRSRSVTSNAMFAVGTAFRLGLPAESIRNGLAAFDSSLEQNPGRHNWIEGLPFELILNWADGSVALADIIETTNLEPTAGCRRIMLAVPGNRSDEWIRDVGRTAAGHFDRYCCAEMEMHLRGREPGTAPALLEEGLRSRGVPAHAIVRGGAHAACVATILDEARPGDRVLLSTYEENDGVREIEKFRRNLRARA